MGWAAQLNHRTRRLRFLCERLPREAVFAVADQMSEQDQAIVRQMLDAVHPPEPLPVPVQ